MHTLGPTQATILAVGMFLLGYAYRMLQGRSRPYWKIPETPEEWNRLNAPHLPPATYQNAFVGEIGAGANSKIAEVFRMGLLMRGPLRKTPTPKEKPTE